MIVIAPRVVAVNGQAVTVRDGEGFLHDETFASLAHGTRCPSRETAERYARLLAEARAMALVGPRYLVLWTAFHNGVAGMRRAEAEASDEPEEEGA